MTALINFAMEYPIVTACAFGIPFIAFPAFRNAIEAMFYLTAAVAVLVWLAKVVAP